MLAAALAAGSLPAGAQGVSTPAASQENVRHLATIPGTTGGHSVVEGNRLYVGAYGLGMRIFNVSNPRNPVQIGQYIPGPRNADDPGLRADAVPDAAVWDGRHIASLNGTGRTGGTQQTEFLDVTNPASPVLLHRFTGATDGEAHNGDFADDARLWLPSGGNFRVYDARPLLQNPPAAPVRLFGGNPQTLWQNSPYRQGKPAGSAFDHIHDLEIYENRRILLPQWEWVDQDGDEIPDPTYAEKDIVLVAAATGYSATGPGANTGAVFIVDITNPSTPVVINKWQNPNSGDLIRYLHEVQFVDGDPSTMVVTDEDLHSGCEGGRIYTVRVSEDLMTATKLNEWAIGAGQADTPTCMGAHVFSTHDRHMFMGAYTAGLQVIDLRDPANPKRAGRYIAEGMNSWGALYHAGVVYVGDFGARGLDVFEFIKDPAGKAHVKAPNPAHTQNAVRTAAGACDPDHPSNGVSSFWVPIPEGARDGTKTIKGLGSGVSPSAYDVDIYFYNENCAHMAGTALTTVLGDAQGIIPAGAAYAFVTLFAGAPQWVYAQIG
jgi:hypothetical protein